MSSLQIGIVGLPNVGKSTLFNALTNNNALAANYPFATIEPNTGIVPIPDPRLEQLAQLFRPGASRSDGGQGAGEQRSKPYSGYGEQVAQAATQPSAESTGGVTSSAGQQDGAAKGPEVIPAAIKFVDIAGLVAGAHKGEGLGNQFLSHIREVDALVMVVRAFSGEVQHVENSVDPKRDIEIILTELELADLQSIDKRLPVLDKEARANPKLKPEAELLNRAKELLESGQPLNSDIALANQIKQSPVIGQLQLMTLKPIIYVFNVDEDDLTDVSKQQELNKLIAQGEGLFLSAAMESQLKDLLTDEAKELLNDSGVDEPGLDKLARTAYSTLNLQSFLTAGEKEVRAWTIKAGSTAPQAAGAIHSDFQKGFIAADVVDLQDLLAAGSWTAARSLGKVRTEGKTYVMRPNDVVEFKFNA
ncbi:MAG TPA: redox-regulated ATPase YchF [Candidatus Saccharimonadales bacterium]|jgi:hypothetical protein